MYIYIYEYVYAYAHKCICLGPPMADPNAHKDEKFVVVEFERLIEDSAANLSRGFW